MRVFLLCTLLAIAALPASAEEWISRGHGDCYNWEGRWDVQQEQSGVWVGVIDFVHVGGPCAAETQQVISHEVRAAIVGRDFFARRITGGGFCALHGNIRGSEVRGMEVCSGTTRSLPFAVRLAPPEPRQ
jgi:hypothetical protein